MTTAYVFVILTALVFDFINGWHDSANSIATVVGTKTLTPLQAVLLAAFGNFIAIAFFELHVAKTIGKGLVHPEVVDLAVIFAALAGAIVWNIITWYYGIPSSSSHALMGGLGGAALMKAGPAALLAEGWLRPVLFIFLAPTIGMIVGMVTMLGITWILHACERFIPQQVLHSATRKLQLLSSLAYSIGHGGNDAQKTMGIITIALVSAGWQTSYDPPLWVALVCHLAMALGTMAGGWRIVRTMGTKLCDLKVPAGVSAELSGAVTLYGASMLGVPVSTTHTITGAILGSGSVWYHRLSAVRWGVVPSIVVAWILTIPASALVAALSWLLVDALTG